MPGSAPGGRGITGPRRMAGVFAGLIAAGLLQPGPIRAQEAQASPCGETVVVERGDTLSRIAGRCGVGEGAILRANPRIQGSADLQVGATIQLRPGSAGVGLGLGQATDRLGAFASDLGGALGEIAGRVGSSVEDLLAKNPDLQGRLRQFGTRLGVTDAGARAAGVSILPRSGPAGTAVALSAKGLPANTPVLLGGGAPGAAYEVLDSALTGGDGALEAAVRVPGWAGVAGPFVFVVAGAERGVLARSEPFLVTGPAPPPAGTTRP